MATRAVAQYPALIAALERARIAAIPVYAAAARRAAALAAIDDDTPRGGDDCAVSGSHRDHRRGHVARGSIDAPQATAAIAALAAIDPDARGDYAGRVVAWLGGTIGAAIGAAECGATGRTGAQPRRPRLDADIRPGAAPRAMSSIGKARAIVSTRRAPNPARLRRLLDDSALPYLATAASLVAAATVLEGTPSRRRRSPGRLRTWTPPSSRWSCDGPERRQSADLGTRCREIVTALTRAARSGDTKNATRVAPRLRLLADTFLARGLIELVYAMALGQPDGAPIHAADAASRHDLGLSLPGFGRLGAWRRPAAGADRMRDWHVTGSLLGLDVVLAPLSPRQALDPAAVDAADAERRRPAGAHGNGRADGGPAADRHRSPVPGRGGPARPRAAGRHSLGRRSPRPSPVRSICRPRGGRCCSGPRVSPPPQRGCLPTNCCYSDCRTVRNRHDFDAWGAAGEPRIGCSCLQLPLRGKTDLLTGRWHTGVMATGFPDLNLRLAEMLAELRMPAALLPSVLASATWDLVLNVRSRDFDDRQGLVDFVDALTIDRVEQDLALLTTDGPLVPLADGSAPAAQRSLGAPPLYPPQPQQ